MLRLIRGVHCLFCGLLPCVGKIAALLQIGIETGFYATAKVLRSLARNWSFDYLINSEISAGMLTYNVWLWVR